MESKYTRPTYLEYGKEAHELTIEVLLKDKESGELIGKKVITRAQLAKALQPMNRSCHGAVNGKFILEV